MYRTFAIAASGSILVLFLIYLFLIAPRIFHRPDLTIFKNTLFAHRGLHDNSTNAPENSLNAFKLAVNAGYGIELDVQLSKDGIPMVFHDMNLERACNIKGTVDSYACEELQKMSLFGTGSGIPRLEDVLELVKGKVPLLVELKSESTNIDVFKITDRILQNYKGIYFIESFNPLGVRWYKKNRKNVVRGQLSDNFVKENADENPFSFFIKNLWINFLGRPDFIAYNRKYPNVWSKQICRKIFGCPVAAWTVKSEDELTEDRKNFDIFIFESFQPK